MQDVLSTIPELDRRGDDSSPSDSPGLVLAREFWRQRRRIVRFVIAGAVLGVLIAFLTPNRYQSTIRLMPPDSPTSSGLGALAMLAGNAGGGASQIMDAMPMKSTGALFMGILRSRTVQDQVVTRFDLKKVYGARYSADARKKLEDYTEINEDRRAGIITLKVTDRDPQRAAAMARTYVEVLDSVVVEQNTSAARREREFLDQRLKAVDVDLGTASRALSEFSSKNATIDIGQQAKGMIESAAELQGQLIAAQSEFSALKQVYTDANVRVQSAHARIAELQSALHKLGGADGASQNADALYPSLRKLPLLAVTYAELYRRTKVQEAVFEVLTKQYELAKVQEAKEVPSVRVLDPADVPEKKSEPKRSVIVLISMLLSFVIGSLWVWSSQRWQALNPNDRTKRFVTEVWSEFAPGALFWTSKLPPWKRKKTHDSSSSGQSS